MPLRNPFDFTGKTVVLAGATGGFGRPISVAFAAGGANIAACARSEQALADLAAEVRGAGSSGEVMTAKVDLTARGARLCRCGGRQVRHGRWACDDRAEAGPHHQLLLLASYAAQWINGHTNSVDTGYNVT